MSVVEPSSSSRVHELEAAHIDFAVAQHRHHFPSNAVTRLGIFVLRGYYTTFIDSPFARALIITQEEQAAGFLVGVLDTAAHRRWLKQHRKRALAGMAVRAVVLHPIFSGRLFLSRLGLVARRRRTMPGIGPGRQSGPTGPVSVLSHVAVARGLQGSGLGSALVCHFIAEASEAGARCIALAALANESRVVEFYERHGWTRVRTRQTFDGRWIWLYELALPGAAREGSDDIDGRTS